MGTFYSIPDNRTPQWSQEHLRSPYDIYFVKIVYRTSYGKLQLPLGSAITVTATGSPGTPSPQVQVLPSDIVVTRVPYTVKYVYWVAQRLGDHPTIPSPYSPDPNLSLADTEFGVMTRRLTTDGLNYIYSIGGMYVYFCKQPVVIGGANKMIYPVGPYDKGVLGEVPDGDTSTSIIG